jgi:hypothetical protein
MMVITARYITGVKKEWRYISASIGMSNDNLVFFVPYYHQANARKQPSLGCEHKCNLLQFVIAFDTSTLNWQHYKAICIVLGCGTTLYINLDRFEETVMSVAI